MVLGTVNPAYTSLASHLMPARQTPGKSVLLLRRGCVAGTPERCAKRTGKIARPGHRAVHAVQEGEGDYARTD